MVHQLDRSAFAAMGIQHEGFKGIQALGPSSGKLAGQPLESRLKIITQADAPHLSKLEHSYLLKNHMTNSSGLCLKGLSIIQALGKIGHKNMMTTPFTGGFRAYFNAEASDTHLHVEIDKSAGLGPMRPFKDPEGEHESMQHEWNSSLNQSADQLVNRFLEIFPEKQLSFSVLPGQNDAHQMQEFVDLLNQSVKNKTAIG